MSLSFFNCTKHWVLLLKSVIFGPRKQGSWTLIARNLSNSMRKVSDITAHGPGSMNDSQDACPVQCCAAAVQCLFQQLFAVLCEVACVLDAMAKRLAARHIGLWSHGGGWFVGLVVIDTPSHPIQGQAVSRHSIT